MKRLAFLVVLFTIHCSLFVSPIWAQNPYLPLWEHLPDGEPRVFEDPDHPGKYRAYIIGSHDVTYTAYGTCRGPQPVARRRSYLYMVRQWSVGHHVRP